MKRQRSRLYSLGLAAQRFAHRRRRNAQTEAADQGRRINPQSPEGQAIAQRALKYVDELANHELLDASKPLAPIDR